LADRLAVADAAVWVQRHARKTLPRRVYNGREHGRLQQSCLDAIRNGISEQRRGRRLGRWKGT
jgi:hypothetical protein